MRHHYWQSKRANVVNVVQPSDGRLHGLHVVSINGCAHVIATSELTESMRALVKLLRDAVKREGITYEERAELELEQDHPSITSRSWLPAIKEHRASPRGASGLHDARMKRIRGYAEQVSMRDNRKPAETLAPLNVVGVATHPEASAEDYAWLLRQVRETPAVATVRVMFGGTTYVMTEQELRNGRGTVVPVSDYGQITQPRQKPVQRVTAVSQPAENHRVRLMHVSESGLVNTAADLSA
jgi:hypothetical protein